VSIVERRILGLIGSVLFVVLVFWPSIVSAQRDVSVSELFHNTWRLKGSTERYLDTLAALAMVNVERQGNNPVQNTTVIEEQNISIGVQNAFSPTAIMNSQATSVVNSDDVKIVGQQDAADASVNANINAAGGNASSVSSQEISHVNPANPHGGGKDKCCPTK
jgi:hypothetical protein